jgi:quinol monooxygenase YgiN
MTDTPVIVFASFRPAEGQQQAVHELLTWMVEHTRREPGCERYDLFHAPGDDATFHLFERYRDDEALQAHRATEHYVEYRRRIVDMLDGPIDVLVLDPVDTGR